ncbi:MAG: AAA family ATPase [Planctomycetaceae bacterium]|nr:AAA family ATPase [Planctomycetaceae bacterium]
MKIRQLHINRFGHFNECDLVFPGEGLQVIYGPNEAGKTTLLEFLRGLLFDFPTRSPYDFGGQGEMAGVATLELRDGRAVELRRRKGNKDKVSIKLDGQPTDFDDAGWLRLLDHADRGLFESVFAFGLDQLSQGEASLKHESLQSALFGGSLGGTNSPDKIVTELSRQADELFKKGGSKPSINALVAELKKLSKEIKDRSLRPEKYHEAEAAVAKAAEHAQSLHLLVDRLRREHSKIDKRVRAWPKWWDLQQRRSEREELSVPKNVPADVRQRSLALGKELKSLADEQAKRSDEIKQAEQSRATLKLDPGAVSYRAEIKSCLELRQSFIEAKNDLPERQRQREAMRLLIDRELAELRPGWSHDDLRAFSVDVATRTEIDHLSNERRERSTAHTKLTVKRDGDSTNLERARDDLAEIGAPRDVTALVAVLADEADFVANQKQSESTRGELAKLERKLAIQCRKLAPPLSAAMPTPQELPIPRAETIAEFETRFGEVREQLRAASGSVEEDEAEQREIEKSLATAMSSHVVPSLDERDAARERRDAGWKLVRQKYISAEPADSAIDAWLDGEAAPLPDGYERAVRVADDIADQIYDNANEVAKREELRRQLAALAVRLDQKRQRITELERQQAELQSKWLALWQPCGFEPLNPDAMLGWLNDHDAVCATIAQRDELIEEQSQLGERIASFELRLRAAIEPNQQSAPLPACLTSARQAVDEAKEQQRRTTELQKEVQRLDKQLAKYDEELQSLAKRETAANIEWQGVLNRLNLPADWDAELAREVIDKLSATRVRLNGLPEEEARIDAMQSRIQEFDQRVHSLCEALAPELLRDPPELAIEKLAEQVEQAAEAQRKHDDLSQKLSAAREQLKSLSERHTKQDSERACLFALAEATTETEFLDVVSRAEKVVRLDGEIEQLKREVDLIRAGDDRDEFEFSLAHSERSVLEGEQRDFGEQLRQQEQLKREADEAVGAARKELAQLDGSGDVAILTEELSRKRSLLAAEVDRYMPLVYARHLLNASVSRYAKDNQPEMIAIVSRLLRHMTAGKYIEFDRTGGSKQSILIRRADGAERTPDQLSTGTREQLYLAIRLAYVLHYCGKNQPLPIIIDDVLVNFDDARTRQTLTALAEISQTAQVLFFTCHPHMVALAREVVPGLNPVILPGVDHKSEEWAR